MQGKKADKVQAAEKSGVHSTQVAFSQQVDFLACDGARK